MASTWKTEPKDRISFTDIVQIFMTNCEKCIQGLLLHKEEDSRELTDSLTDKQQPVSSGDKVSQQQEGSLRSSKDAVLNKESMKKKSKKSKKGDQSNKKSVETEQDRYLEETRSSGNPELDEEKERKESESCLGMMTTMTGRQEGDNNSNSSMYMVPLELQEVVVHPLLQD